MATYYIDARVPAGGTGTETSPFNQFPGTANGVAIAAGHTYLLARGSTLAVLVLVRAAAAQTVIGAYGTGLAPVITGSFVVEGANNVVIRSLAFATAQFPAVIIRDGARNISVLNNIMTRTQGGVFFGDGVQNGAGSIIRGNTIVESRSHGIALDKCGTKAAPILIDGNTIRDSASHGMEVNGNGATITGNTVTGSGRVTQGCSNIHVYGGGFQEAVPQSDGFGRDNTITGNTCRDCREQGNGFDGNGIQLDEFCDGNTVRANTCTGNDGAGVILYGASGNVVADNVTEGNGLSRNGSRFARFEFAVMGDLDGVRNVTQNNTVTGNRVTARDATVQPFFTDRFTAARANTISGNSWQGAVVPPAPVPPAPVPPAPVPPTTVPSAPVPPAPVPGPDPLAALLARVEVMEGKLAKIRTAWSA